MKKLPIGIQHFPTLIHDGFLYVDKTQLIHRLINEQRGHFLARPRRFGKSLLCSTLLTIFQGKKELFKECWISTSEYQWPCHPVLWFDFSTLIGRDKKTVERSLQNALIYAATDIGITLTPEASPVDTFISLVRQASLEGEVVIIIDEYDHPLLKLLDNKQELIQIRDLLSEFYTAIKSCSRFIRYVFITGVSKFSKVSLFSGMNNIQDITLNPNYATLTGVTEIELRKNYVEWIETVAAKREEPITQTYDLMRKWYNGYCFSTLNDTEKVYNPVSLHNFLESGRLSNFWFGTATPTFAIDLIRRQNYPIMNLEGEVTIGASLDEHHEVTQISLIPLLFQTGYLTIQHFDEINQTYKLTFPNEEVRRSFFDHLLTELTKLNETQLESHFLELDSALHSKDLKNFFDSLNILLAEIPYSIHIAKEAYYHSLIYLIIRALKVKVQPEVLTSRGRMDLVAEVDNIFYIFEFKFGPTAKEALEQIIQKGYADRYKNLKKKVILVGISISRKKRKIDDWIEQEL